MERPIIYLDNAATTRVSEEVRDAMLPFLGERVGNPSSTHRLGVQARRALSGARKVVARSLGASPADLVFTSGGTEANALAILGTARRRKRPGHIICSAIEHASVIETCRELVRSEGWSLSEIPVDGDGMVSPEDVAAAVRGETVLLSLVHGNNIIGTVQPMREILRAALARKEDLVVHCDCVQSFLKEPTDLRGLGSSMVSVSGHKVHGPSGIGALATRSGVYLRPLWHGGSQEGGWRAGTQNLLGAVGFAAAVSSAMGSQKEDRERMVCLRDRLIDGLLQEIPGARLNGHPDQRLANNVHVSLSSVSSEPLLHALAARGLIASAGAACHSSARSPSHVLQAIGYSEARTWGHLRLTLSRFTRQEEIDSALRIVVDAWRELRA